MSHLRFYNELVVKDVSLMPKFSDYGVGNSSSYIPRFIKFLEKIYGFNFTYLADHPQNFGVSKTTQIFSINSTGSLSTNDYNGDIGRAFPHFVLINQPVIVGLSAVQDSDPIFGPFYIRCEGNQIASYTLGEPLGSNITLFLEFRIHSSSSTPQTILGIIEGSTIVISIKYLPEDGFLQFFTGSNTITTPPATITPGFIITPTQLTKC